MIRLAEFFRSLEDWVNMQRSATNIFNQLDKELKSDPDTDRLDYVIAVRALFEHMMKTIKAFDNWLKDPLILANLDKKSIEEVWDISLSVFNTFLELDIKHTSQMKEQIERMIKERKINTLTMLTMSRRGEGEETRTTTQAI